MNVLLVRSGALGDLLLLRRAVAALREAGHRVSLLAPAGPGRALVGPGPSEVDELLPGDGVEAVALSAPGAPLPRSLSSRLSAFDAAVCYTRDAVVPAQIGSVVPRVLRHDPSPPAGGPHASAWLLRGLLPLPGLPPVVAAWEDSPVPSVTPTDDERSEARARLAGMSSGFVALHPGSGSPRKDWPAERFDALARQLAGGQPRLIVEGPADRAAAAALAAFPHACVARDWPIRILAAALAEARLFVGNDSGITHLAAAAAAPTLALFGPTDPLLWSPVGARVAVVHSPTETMEGLPLDAVLLAARRLLGTG